MLISLIYLLVLFFDFLAQYVQIRIMQRVGQQTMYDMRQEIFAHIQRLSMSYFDKNPVGRLVTRVTTDVDALNDLFAAGVVTMINDFFLLAVMVGVLLYLNWRLALAALSGAAADSCWSPLCFATLCAKRTAAFARPLRASMPFFRNTFPA